MWEFKSKAGDKLLYRNSNTGEECTFSKIYDHRDLGVFYMVDNVLMLPYSRKYLWDLAGQMEKIGIEKDELNNRMEEVMSLCRDKKQGFELDVYAIAQRITATLKDHWDYQKTALLAVSLCVIQAGDNIGAFDQLESQRRMAEWGKDRVMMDFFLSALSKRLEPLNNSFNAFTHLSSLGASPSKVK